MSDGEVVEKQKTQEKDSMDSKGSFTREVVKVAVENVSHYSWWAKLVLYLFYTGVSFVVLFLVFVNLPITKSWTADKALGFLNEDFGVEISEKNISLNIFGDVSIDGLEVKDHKGFPFIKIKKYHANSNWFHLFGLGKTNSLAFRSMTLKNADVKIITYKGDTLDNLSLLIQKFETDKPRTPGKPVFQLYTRVRVLDSKVSIVNQNLDGENGNWLSADHFNLVVPSLKIIGPEIKAQIANLSFYTQRHGKKHFIETFSTNFTLDRKILSFIDLTLNTDHSLLMGDIVFNLGKKARFSDFTNKVFLDVHLKKGSIFSGYDFSYFVSNWDSYSGINLSGDIKGPLSKFKLKNFLINSGEININTSETQIKNLFKGRNNTGDFNFSTNDISVNLTYPELKRILPSNISKKLGGFADSLKNIKFIGQADINQNSIVAGGSLFTEIGYINIKNFNLLNFSTKKPKYDVDFSVENLNTKPIIKQKELEQITGDIHVKGEGFILDSLVSSIKADFQIVDVLDKKRINNLHINGILDKKKYSGKFVFNDKNIRANIQSVIDFSTNKFRADIDGNINKLSLNYLGYKIQDSTEINSILSAKISMNNLDDMNLNMNFRDLKFISPKHEFNVNKAEIYTNIENYNRIIYIDAKNILEGEVSGKYNLSDLPNIFKSEITGILSGFISNETTYNNENFNFNFNIDKNFIKCVFPDTEEFQTAKINGNYLGKEKKLTLNADFPNIKYYTKSKKEITSNNISVDIKNTFTEKYFTLNVGKIFYKNNLLNDIKIKGINHNDEHLLVESIFKIENTKNKNLPTKEYNINLLQTSLENGDIFVKFTPSFVKSNGDVWYIDTSEELNQSLIYSKDRKNISVNNFRIYSDDSSLLLNGNFENLNNFNSEVRLSEIKLEKLIKFITNENNGKISGLANGIANIKIDEKNIHPIVNLRIENIKVGNKAVGNLVFNANVSDVPNVYNINANIKSPQYFTSNNMYVSGLLDNNSQSKKLNLKASLNKFDISFLEDFLSSTLSNLRGNTNGNLNVISDFKNIDYSGEIGISDMGFKLNFTGADYSFEDSIIPVSKGLVVLEALKFNDGRNNSQGTVAGLINFENPSSVGLDLMVQAENIIILNTTYRNDFDIFWGRLTGKGDVYISGPISKLNIDANLKILGGGEFVLNTDNSSSVKDFNMLKFLKKDKNSTKILVEQQNTNTNANISIGLILDIDKNSSVKILLGDNIGNISMRGSAENLRFNMNRTGTMSINGIYSVENGTYISKVILERVFQIERGSSISWDENVLNPSLDIVANYNSSVSNLGEYLGVGKLQPTSVELQIKIKEKLQELRDKEAITMDIVLPNASSQTREALQTKLNTEDEKIKQMGSILLLNNFNLTSMLEGFALENAATSTGYSLILKNLSSVFNAISNDFQIDMDYIKGDLLNNTTDRANANISINVSPRMKVKTGIGIPMFKSDNDKGDRDNEVLQNSYLSGEGQIEYDISKLNDGSTILHVYSKPANIGLMPTSSVGQNQNYGAGIVYTKSFSSIFGRRKSKNKTQSIDNPQSNPSAK